ncbi:hypothetical protein [Sphingomonas sp.]|uniref:hypothetical protein n=1 Tax=Sphingomonas sp. TaxID=28214 RepID=UPI002CFD1C09|nr:hypothetical protein [Sphingomonas sp.]HTG37476.1 hypothetical protein [Sphingomonas sp.]
MVIPHALRLPLAPATCLFLLACGAPQPAAPSNETTKQPEPTPGPTVPAEPVGLRALLPGTIEAAAPAGELACSFSARNQTLLLARGDVDAVRPAEAVVRSDAGPVRLGRAGGFDAMIDGGTFQGEGITAQIALTGPAVQRGESPPRPATLTLDRPGAPPWRIAGEWTCGP